MPRTRSSKPRESIWLGAPYGYTKVVGNPNQWRSAFDDALHNMGIGEARIIVGEDDPFKILGIALSATAAEAKAAYRKLIMKWHPDKNPGNTEAETMTKRIIAAYKILEPTLT